MSNKQSAVGSTETHLGADGTAGTAIIGAGSGVDVCV